MAKIALIGATGGIGRHVCSRALADGHAVVALARTPSKLDPHPELTVVQGCVTDAQAVSRTVADCDIVLSCLGTSSGDAPVVTTGTQHIVTAMRTSNVDRVAMISSVGVGNSHAQGKRVSRIFMHVIVPLVLRQRYYELEGAEAVARTIPNAVIVRPTGLTNKRGSGRYRVEPHDSTNTSLQIPREDVAAFMVALISNTSWDGQSVSLFSA